MPVIYSFSVTPSTYNKIKKIEQQQQQQRKALGASSWGWGI
jgi:hypothetical protein